MISIPRPGGSLSEGVIGYPRFINPLFALSDADRDMTALIYSGLLKYEPDGTLVPDLAESYTISADKLVYTFTLRADAQFHDGTPVTADDIIFTIGRAKDANIKSPKRPSWEGVTVEKKSDRDITFTLRQPFPAFLENATLGILPSHLWKPIDTEQFIFSDLNILPIGSGPYAITSISRDASGRPESYTLHSYKKYALGQPYLKTLNLHFYSNEDALLTALTSGTIEAVNGISPTKAKEISLTNTNISIDRVPLPRVFSVFFNQNKSHGLFANKEIRLALNNVVDKNKIIEDVFSGYATAVDSPIPPNLRTSIGSETSLASSSPTWTVDQAQKSLEKAGWKKNTDGIYEKTVKKEKYQLRFSLSVPSVPELKATAELLKDMWTQIGADVTLKFFDPNDFSQNVLRPREYEALLFGEIVGRDIDLFAFWHSSQRNDPGLNIALYTNIKIDKLLSEARTIDNQTDRLIRYGKFEDEIKKDVPAIFLYSPDFIYGISKEVNGISLGRVTTPAERFLGIREWYRDTDRVWEYFKNTDNRTLLSPFKNIVHTITN
ncbi:MAG: hypothetical protein RLZZ347_628 [Candidatus Parcubacteria bacterium]